VTDPSDPSVDGNLPEPSGKIDSSLTRQILLLAVPLTLSRQLENVVGMADIFMVGRLGPDAISAVGISRAISIVVGAFMIAVTTGTFAMVAQAIGAGSHREASAAAKQSITLLFLLSVAIGLLGILGAPHFLAGMSVTPQVVALGTPYLQVFFAGAGLMTVNRAVSTCLYGAGDTRTPLYISLLSNVVKIASSYLLIFGAWGMPRLGVTGAALGTVVGRVCAVAAGLWALYSGRFSFAFVPGTSYRPNVELARRILKIGIPSAIQGFLRNGSRLIAVKMVALTPSSTSAVAAYSIGR
jgi:putative MATE family efflux protein